MARDVGPPSDRDRSSTNRPSVEGQPYKSEKEVLGGDEEFVEKQPYRNIASHPFTLSRCSRINLSHLSSLAGFSETSIRTFTAFSRDR
jgi:hypothetical protein